MEGYRCETCNRLLQVYDARCPFCWQAGSVVPNLPHLRRPPADTLGDAPRMQIERLSTGLDSLDRVFGGTASGGHGMARPSCVLLSGGQGGGKSTLALQIAAGVGAHRALYLASEEPREQIRDRVERLRRLEELRAMRLLEVHDMAEVAQAMRGCTRTLVIVDSLNELVDARHDTADENANALRRVQWFFDQAKATQRVVLLVAQLNKDDYIAGHRKIQYKPDAAVRIDRVGRLKRVVSCPVKNRFGEVGVEATFLMMESGLVEVPDVAEAQDEDAATGAASPRTARASRPRRRPRG
jgi:predicted ATP-dependent serine protease